MADQKSRILTAALGLTTEANASVPAIRRIPNGVALEIVERSMALTASLPFSVREHAALRDISDFITISHKGHSALRVARNVDLLPVGHPMSTAKHRMNEASLRHARAQWVSSDMSIRSDEARALVAAALTAEPGSFEAEYFSTRVMALPQGTVPLRALVAAFGDGNSSAARRARAMLQRRDSEGRFAWMGGGMSALVKRAAGVFNLSGRVVAHGGALPNGDTNTFDIETKDGKIKRVKATSSTSSKAFLGLKGDKEGYSPEPADYSSADDVMDESEVTIVDAPNGFYKDGGYTGPGERFTDDAYDVIKFDPNDDEAPNPTFGELDFDKPVYVVRREGAKPSVVDTVVQSWGEVQDFIRIDEPKRDKEEGRKPSVVARLSDDQIQQVADEIGDSDDDPETTAEKLFADIFGGGDGKGTPPTTGPQFPDAPDGAYVWDTSESYQPEGRTDQESNDYTDDPAQLASRKDEYSDDDLITALKGGVLPADGVEATGYGQLPFEAGDEYVPAEALYEALNKRGLDANNILSSIYKGDSEKPSAPEEPVATLPSPKPEDRALPALLDGLSDEEKAEYKKTGDHKPYLPKNAEPDVPEGYTQISPEPFTPAASDPDLFDPLNLADRDSEELFDALRTALEPGSGGMGPILTKDMDGEDVRTDVPAEAIRDALQLRGESTNEFIQSVYDEGAGGEVSEQEAAEVVAEISSEDSSVDEDIYSLDGDWKWVQPAGDTQGHWEPTEQGQAKIDAGEAITEPEPPQGKRSPKKKSDVGPLKRTAKSRTGQYFAVKPNGEKDRSLQFTDEYIEHLFGTPADELTLTELTDLENIGSQVPSSVKPFVAGAVNDAKTEIGRRANGLSNEPNDSSFTAEKYIKKGKAKTKAKTKPKAAPEEQPTAEEPQAAELPEENGTVAIPDEPHIATVSTKDLLPGDVTVKDHFVIEEVYTDDESLAAKGKATYGMKVKGHYPGHVSQDTKIWDAEVQIEVYRNVDAPEAGDKPVLSKPKLDPYKKSNGGKGIYKEESTGEWLPKDPKDRERYLDDLAEYEKALDEAKNSWYPPDSLESYETADNAISVDPENPVLVVTVSGQYLQPGDVTFKNTKGADGEEFHEFFVVQNVELSEDGKTVNVTGYYPGHEVQTKTWQAKTPITVMRGVNEPDMPQPGDKPALERPKKGDPDIKAKYDAFNAAKKESGESWTPPDLGYDKEALQEPKAPKAASKLPPFTGHRMRDLLNKANGDADVLAQLLQAEEVVYFDFETSGDKKWSEQQPIQVAAYKYKGGKIVGEYITFINPGQPLGEFYTEKDPADILKDSDGNPISNEFLASQPSREQVMQELIEFMGPDAILVAHNAPFDLGVLDKALGESGLEYEWGGVIDTLPLARAVYNAPSYNLEAVATRLGLADGSTDWHDAKADAAVLEGIVFDLLAEMKFSGQGSEYLNYDGGFKAAAEDYKRYQQERKEYLKKKADYEAAKVVADLMEGKKAKSIDEIIASVEAFEKIDPDTVGPNDPTPQSQIADPNDNTVISIDGKMISNSWVDDDENTTDLGAIPVEEWQPGDFFQAKGGGWYELISSEDDPSSEKRKILTARFLKTGTTKTFSWIKYNSYKIRRDNDKISGDEPALTETPVEPPSVPADSAEPKKYADWLGMEVLQGADGVYYAKDITGGVVSQLKSGLLQPPALPFFAPLGGGNNINTGEGYYWDTKGVRHWGKYGAAGALVRRKNANGDYEYLLAKRASHLSTGGGKWAYPGGAHKDLADSQSPTATSATEFKEEMGGDLSGMTPVAVHDNYLAPDWKYQTNIYEVAPGQMSDLSPKDGENSKAQWFTAEEIKQLAADGRLHPDFADVADDIFDIAEPAPETPEADKAPEVSGIEESLTFPIDMTGWKKYGDAAGSNAGGFYYDPNTGDQYYVKFPKSESHARNEALASALYEAAGVKVGRIYLGKDANGNTVLISPIVEGANPDFKKKMKDPEALASAQEGFAVDAWMNNYDSVGLVYDNMVTVGNDVYRIDPGGALLYRAQGKSKKDQLTPEVTQIDTLRDPSVNPQMASVFSGMSDEQIAESVKRVAKISPEKIDALVDAAFGDLSPEDAEFLKERLKARREDLMSRYEVSEATPSPTSPAEGSETGDSTALDTYPSDDIVAEEVTDIAPAPGPVSEDLSNAIDSVVAGGSVDDAVEILSDSGSPDAKNLATKIKKAKAAASAPEPASITNEEAAAEDNETSAIDNEIDGIDPNVSIDEVDDKTIEHPDLIIDQIEAKFGAGSNNGDGTWTVWSATSAGATYEAVIVKNKDNTFSAIYRMVHPDGSVTEVDRYGTYHSFKALNNRLNWSVFPTLEKNFSSTGGSPKKMAAVYANLAKNTYWHKTGKSKVDLRKIKITHASPDGMTEIALGDRIWDSKTGKFGKIVKVFPTYSSNGYTYTDYVKIKFDDGKTTNAPTTKRVWKVGSDEKIVAKPGTVPDYFPNPNPTKTKGASSAKATPTPSAPKADTTPETPDTAPEPSTPEAPEVPETSEATAPSVPEDLNVDTYEKLISSGLTYEKNTPEMFNEYGADTYDQYKKAIEGKKVKGSDDKNILPSFLVEDSDGSIGVTTAIDSKSGTLSVTWIYGNKSGTTDSDISAKSVKSKERYLPPSIAKSVYGADVDTTIQESAQKFMVDYKEKMSAQEKAAAEAAKKKAEADAAKKAAEAAKQAVIDSQVTGSGFDPVQASGSADWTQDVMGTPSVQTSLDKISKSDHDANNGSMSLVDAAQIEDLKVRFTKIEDMTGTRRTRLRFKLTEWAGSELVKKLTGSGLEGVEVTEVTDRISMRKFAKSTDPDAIRVEDGVWPSTGGSTAIHADAGKKGRTFRVELKDENGTVIGYADIHRGNKSTSPIKADAGHSSGNNVANHNKVDLYLAGDASPADVEKALGRLGIDARPASEADVNGLIENKMLSMFGGFLEPSRNLSGPERKQMLDAISNQWGFTPADVKPAVIDSNRGTIMYQMPREVAEKIVENSPKKSAYHHWGAGFSSAQKIYDLVFAGGFNSAMMPTSVRMDEGINTAGASSTADQHTLGADYMFFYGSYKDPEGTAKANSGHGSVIVFDMVDLVQNMDWYGTPGDYFGQRQNSFDPTYEITRFDQFMVRDAVPLSMAARIVIPSNVKSELKKMLTQMGITEWNGIPVDKLFGLTS